MAERERPRQNVVVAHGGGTPFFIHAGQATPRRTLHWTHVHTHPTFIPTPARRSQNLLIGFLSPQIDPDFDPDGPSLPTSAPTDNADPEEHKPFTRKLAEFQFWCVWAHSHRSAPLACALELLPLCARAAPRRAHVAVSHVADAAT